MAVTVTSNVTLSFTDDPGSLGPGVEFTIQVGATEIEPWVELIGGSTAVVDWHDSEDNLLETGLTPTIARPTDGLVIMRVTEGLTRAYAAIKSINLGFDHTQDPGKDSLADTFDYPAQPVTGISNLTLCTSLQYFMAANGPLTGSINFTNLNQLEHIECYEASVTSVNLTGCSSLIRLCLEVNAMTTVDLTPVASTLRDLRCAANTGGPITFLSDDPLPVLWHYCTRGQDVVAHIQPSEMPLLEQYWAYDSGVNVVDAPISSLLRSWFMNGNPIETASVDAVLIALDTLGNSNGACRMDAADPRTEASSTAVENLLARGWTLEIPEVSPCDPDYGNPPYEIFVDADITDLSITSSVVAGVLTTTSSTYGRAIWRPDARNAGDIFFEVEVDRSEVDGSTGTDFWAIMVNCDASGNGGVRAMIRWPQVNSVGSEGVSFATSNGAFGSAGSTGRLNNDPPGWTGAGLHKVGLLHYGNQAIITLDGVEVWRCQSATIDGLEAGGYIGVGGNSASTSRVWQQWGYEEVT